jgi:hypothetical protein
LFVFFPAQNTDVGADVDVVEGLAWAVVAVANVQGITGKTEPVYASRSMVSVSGLIYALRDIVKYGSGLVVGGRYSPSFAFIHGWTKALWVF